MQNPELFKKLINNTLHLKDGSNCIVWRGALHNGYGRFTWKGKRHNVHRWMYIAVHGKLPKTLHIDHLCRNRACINPEHLEAVTSRENTMRGNGITAQCARKEKCIRGHLFVKPNYRIIPKSGDRECLICRRIRAKQKRARAALRGGE